MRLVLIFVLAFSLHLLYAEDSTSSDTISFAEKMRTTLTKIIGESWTVKLIGKAPVLQIDNSIILPPLPKLVSDARSVDVFNKKQDKIYR